jgi:hypothetical protein
MKVCLDTHDFIISNPRFDLLYRLKDRFPDFKVSLFTIPSKDGLLEEVKKNLDWIQIIPHGLYHTPYELSGCSYNQFREDIIPKIVKIFNDNGLPFIEGFCAPHWRWNSEVTRALDDMGWWGAISPARPRMPRTKRFYSYTCAINEEFPNLDVLKLHGHMETTRNSLVSCIDNIMKLDNPEWHFVTEFIES